jgi:hypothetical protein
LISYLLKIFLNYKYKKMKKLLTIIALALLAINTHAQTANQKKALQETMETINEMDQMLSKEFTMFTSALDAVSGASFVMGECIVLGAYADEGFKKQCKSMQAEFDKTFDKSTWSFEKYDENNQSLVKVKTKAGQALSSPYNGFQGSATIKINMLVDGLNIDGYFYQSKADKTKFIMMFPVSQMGVFVEMTKKEGGAAANVPVKGNDTDAEATSNKTAPSSPKVDEAKNKAKNAVKGKLGKLL